MSGPACAARRREALGLPRVSNREAERRLNDNQARTARRYRAAARAREGAPAPSTAPDVIATPEVPMTSNTLQDAPDTRQVILLGSLQADPPTTSPPGRTYSPCARCLNCSCREPYELFRGPGLIASTRPSHLPLTLLFTTGSTWTPSLPITGTPPRCGERPSRMRGPPTCPLGTTPKRHSVSGGGHEPGLGRVAGPLPGPGGLRGYPR